MNTATTRIEPLGLNEGFLSRRNWLDWLFAALVLAGGAIAFARYGVYMDVYERGILFAAMPAAIWLGWFWRPLRMLMMVAAALALLAIWSYQAGGQPSLARADQVFWLKYFLSSQSAILWMSLLMFMSTAFYWLGMFGRSRSGTMELIGSRIAWVAVTLALTGTLVRWYESYLIGPDVGHIPISNLYEVFVLFSWLTTTFYLYYEAQYKTRAMGAFVMLVVSAAVGFLLWYTVVRGAQEIQPLVPALKSWWMKLHVPANFIGYGTFSLAAMTGFAYLVKEHGQTVARAKLVPLFVLGAILCAEPFVFSTREVSPVWMLYFGVGAIIVAAILALRRPIAAKLPALEVLDDIMYRAIAVGFAFFTVATILGALWADNAWGTYWQWDPKETWALIVWLNYAAWLHMRLMKGLRGSMAAYWALGGLLVTSFAFLGVNMFLSGLHSYGSR